MAEASAAYPWAVGCDGAPLVVDNDLFALLRAGTDEPDAVAVICGTGINCIGVRRDGETVRYPALGMISGDWGGDWHLGERALWHAARAVDGRGPATFLAEAVPAVFGLTTIQDVTEAIHFGRLPSTALARLSPTIFDIAALGDAIAAQLIDRQAIEVMTLAATTLRRLDLLDADVPVVLGGGILRAEPEILMSRIEEGLAGAAPRARIRVVTAAPILGAAILALETAGLPESAVETARAELRAENTGRKP